MDRKEECIEVVPEGEGGEGTLDKMKEIEHKAVEELVAIEKLIINHHSAAFLMIAVAILGFLSAAMIAGESEPVLTGQRSETIFLSGFVTNETGEPLAGAKVTLRGSDIDNITNGDGYYFLGEMPIGVYEISAAADEHTSVIKRVELTGEGAQMVNFMLVHGSGVEYQEELPPDEPISFLALTSLLAVFFFITSALSLIGAFYAYKGKRFKFTLICAAASTMTYGFIAGTVLGFFAMTFVMLSKNDFDEFHF